MIVVEHDMQVIARSDWIIDIGPGAGDEGGRRGGRHARRGPRSHASRTAPYLKRYL